jgi:hypothetical protein
MLWLRGVLLGTSRFIMGGPPAYTPDVRRKHSRGEGISAVNRASSCCGVITSGAPFGCATLEMRRTDHAKGMNGIPARGPSWW